MVPTARLVSGKTAADKDGRTGKGGAAAADKAWPRFLIVESREWPCRLNSPSQGWGEEIHPPPTRDCTARSFTELCSEYRNCRKSRVMLASPQTSEPVYPLCQTIGFREHVAIPCFARRLVRKRVLDDEVVIRGNSPDRCGIKGVSSSRFCQIAHVPLPARQRVQVEESDRFFRRVRKRVGTFWGNTHKRARGCLRRLAANSKNERAFENTEHVLKLLVVVEWGAGKTRLERRFRKKQCSVGHVPRRFESDRRLPDREKLPVVRLDQDGFHRRPSFQPR